MEQARRQTTFRVLTALAFVYGCLLFAAGISWLRSAMEWAREQRVVDWQQYTMSVLLLSFSLLVVLGTVRPRLTSRLFLFVAGVSVFQAVCMNQSTGDGVGAAIVGSLLMVGVPALLAAWLFAWRSRWRPQPGELQSAHASGSMRGRASKRGGLR